MKYVDLFGGIGGFSLGIEKATNKEWECVWYNDIDKYPVSVYNRRFNEEYEAKDVREVDTRGIPRHDCICAGFPCQSFSIAGKRKGLEDTRGALFFEICRIAQHYKPKLLFLENVKGLLSHDEGNTFKTILKSLWELGYYVEWQVLNSKDFGVPQNRERVFIIGHLGGFGGRQVFPIRTDEGTHREATLWEAESNRIAGSIGCKNQSHQWQIDAGTTLIANCLDANYHKGWLDHGQRTMVALTECRTEAKLIRKNVKEKDWCPRREKELQQRKDDLCNCVTSDQSKESFIMISNPQDNEFKSGLIQSRGFETREDGLSHCLKGGGGGSSKVHLQQIANAVDCDGYLRFGERPRDENGKPQLLPIGYRRIRRLTPTECERLQGFPDGWTKWGKNGEGKSEISDTQRYKMLGNAVTVNVIDAIAERLKVSYL